MNLESDTDNLHKATLRKRPLHWLFTATRPRPCNWHLIASSLESIRKSPSSARNGNSWVCTTFLSDMIYTGWAKRCSAVVEYCSFTRKHNPLLGGNSICVINLSLGCLNGKSQKPIKSSNNANACMLYATSISFLNVFSCFSFSLPLFLIA